MKARKPHALYSRILLVLGLFLALPLPSAEAASATTKQTSVRPWKGKATWKLSQKLFQAQRDQTGPIPKHETHSWYTRATVDAYNQYGQHSNAWDTQARDALVLCEQRWSRSSKISEKTRHDACVKALDAGCEDPSILYYYALSRMRVAETGEAEERGLFAKAAEGLAASRYPAILKCWAFLRAAQQQPAPHGGRTKNQTSNMTILMDAAFSLIPLVTSDPETPTRDLTDLCDEYIKTYRKRYGNPEPGFEMLLDVLRETMPTNSSLPDIIAGDHLLGQAWKARGGGFTDTVTKHSWELYGRFHKQAEEAYLRAWKIDSSNPRIAYRMIRIAAESRGHEEMEKWFQRAMTLDPDYYAACNRKLFFLTPKWGGGENLMLEFAEECFDTKNWEGRLPFILIQAHKHLVGTSSNPGKDAYYLQPHVWTDIHSVYSTSLELYPESNRDRSEYAMLACRAQQWDVAHEQFETLGTNAWKRVFGGQEKLEALRDEVQKHVEGNMLPAPTRLPPELVVAIAEGRREPIEQWIAAGGDINAVSELGQSALALAIDAEDLYIVRYLVENGASLHKQHDREKSPLIRAIRGRHQEIAVYLIEKGAPVKDRDKDGSNQAMEEAFGRRLISVINSLLDHGVGIDWKDKKKNTLLHRAARKGFPEIIELLINRGADTEARNSWQYTPLMNACVKRKADGVRALLEHGALVDTRTTLNTTGLTIAAYRGYTRIIEILLDHEADINIIYKEDGRTPIMAAAEGGHTEAVALFIQRGADRTIRDKKNKTALDIARERGHRDIITLLETAASGNQS